MITSSFVMLLKCFPLEFGGFGGFSLLKEELFCLRDRLTLDK